MSNDVQIKSIKFSVAPSRMTCIKCNFFSSIMSGKQFSLDIIQSKGHFNIYSKQFILLSMYHKCEWDLTWTLFKLFCWRSYEISKVHVAENWSQFLLHLNQEKKNVDLNGSFKVHRRLLLGVYGKRLRHWLKSVV